MEPNHKIFRIPHIWCRQAVAAKKTALINPSDPRGFFVQL
jgi:hypothetical protein